MGKPAAPAPDGEVVAPDHDIMGTGRPAVPAECRLHEAPGIITPDTGEAPLFGDVLDPGMKIRVAPQLLQATCAW